MITVKIKKRHYLIISLNTRFTDDLSTQSLHFISDYWF